MVEPDSEWWRSWFGPGYLALYDDYLAERTPAEIDRLEALLALRPPPRLGDPPGGPGRPAPARDRAGAPRLRGHRRRPVALPPEGGGRACPGGWRPSALARGRHAAADCGRTVRRRSQPLHQPWLLCR